MGRLFSAAALVAASLLGGSLAHGVASAREAGPARPVPAAADVVRLEPNVYELAGRGLRVTYMTESGRAQPRPTLRYRDGSRSRLFAPDELRTEDTELGRLVTVTLRAIPDLGTTTFTLVVPRVNLDAGALQAPVRTFGITTVHSTPFAPTVIPGQVDGYRTTRLAGTARYVPF